MAFKQHKPVIPVLVDGADMPTEQSLPVEISRLSLRHAFRVRDEQLGADLSALAARISNPLDASDPHDLQGAVERTLDEFEQIALCGSPEEMQRAAASLTAIYTPGNSHPTAGQVSPKDLLGLYAAQRSDVDVLRLMAIGSHEQAHQIVEAMCFGIHDRAGTLRRRPPAGIADVIALLSRHERGDLQAHAAQMVTNVQSRDDAPEIAARLRKLGLKKLARETGRLHGSMTRRW